MSDDALRADEHELPAPDTAKVTINQAQPESPAELANVTFSQRQLTAAAVNYPGSTAAYGTCRESLALEVSRQPPSPY